ncbi:antitoxin Xre-like helix-turn-helix domain-containing protein [Spirosoma areae]
MRLSDRTALVFLALKGILATRFFEIDDQTGCKREQLAGVFDRSLKTLQRYERKQRKLNPQDSEKVRN